MTRYRRIAARTLPLVVIWFATLGGVGLLLAGSAGWGPALAVLVLGMLWWRRQHHDGSTLAAPLAALTLALGVAAGSLGQVTVLAPAALLLAAMAAPLIEPRLVARLETHQLPGLRVPLPARVRNPVFATVCCGGVALAAAAAGLTSAAVAAVVIVLLLLAGGALSGHQLLRIRRHLPEREVRAALAAHAPDYYLYFSGRPEAAYQLQMWLPYLERTGTRGALLIRERAFLATALGITGQPVILAESVEAIESAIVPSLGAIFYVNNASRNVDGTRYQQVAHVHLGHGDSDKPASYASVTAMFDRIFVAGQAGVDRFASHGVLVPSQKFVLVGRPQAEAIDVRSDGAGMPERPVVLYAPTWRGVLADMQLSSLGSGDRIVAALLAAHTRVIFRPHPFAERDAESRVLVQRIDAILAGDPAGHLLSQDAAKLTIFECMNASDALVGDVSSVVSDYLYSNKPIALAHNGGGDRLEAEYPLARATYLLPLGEDLSGPLADLLGADSKAAERADVRRYYLGPWPADGYSEVFVSAARAAVEGGPTRLIPGRQQNTAGDDASPTPRNES